MSPIESTSSLIDKLKGILLKQRLMLFTAGLLTTVAAGVGMWLLLSVLANVMVLPVWLKVSLLVATAGVTLFFFARFAFSRLFNGNIESVALGLEQKNPELKGLLIAAIQFSRMKSNPGFSSELMEATQMHAISRAGSVNFNEIVSFHPIARTSRYLAVSAVLGAAMLFIFPGLFSYSYEVFSNPTTEIAPPLSYQVNPIPGTTEWVKYRDIQIGAAIIGQRLPQQAVIHHRLTGGSWQESAIDLKTVDYAAIAAGDSVVAELTLRQINKSFEYYVTAGRIKSDVQTITVVDRPRVENIRVAIFYPDYTGLQPTTIDENNGSFSAVVGSRVNLSIETNLPMQSAELVFQDSSRTPITVNNKTGELSLVVDKSRSYYVSLVDRLGETNPDPIEYTITAIPDEYPTVDVIRPGFDANLTEEMMLPLLARISDDYGFSSLVLKYSIFSRGKQSAENVAVIHFSEKIKVEGDIEFNWDMESLALFPGDYVSYFFEVADNDRVSGPKISHSRQYIARLPSLEEITQQAETEGETRISQTEKLIKTGKELVQRMKSAGRKLDSQNRDSKKADWQQQKDLESIAEKNEEMVKQIDEMAKEMEKSLDELKENSLMSREIMEKMAEIQKLFEEVATPEMREAQKKLMEALEKLDRNEMQKAMKDFQLSHEEMMQRLERTKSLLKKMQMEQKMEAMIRKAEQLVKEQEAVNEKTAASKDEKLPELQSAQEKVKNDLENLKKEVGELKEAMKNAEMEKSPEAQKFAEALEKTDAEKNMQQSSSALKQSQKPSAMKQEKEALSKLSEMLSEMQKQQMAMQGGENKESERAIRQAIDDANQLSQNQESLLREAAAMQPNSMVMRDMAESQQDLAAATEGLKGTIAELGKKSPFVAAELQKLVDQASQNMDEATKQCDSKNSAGATSHQREAMASLNKAANRLMESLDQQKQCNNPSSSCNSGMPKLESLAQQQQQLNEKTQGMCPDGQQPMPGQGNRSAMTREGLQRIAGEQGSIRKSLEELEKEFDGSRQIMGRLDDISKEMKKVEEDLSNGEIGEETSQRQLKIFSRMLEATRTMQRKDFAEQRQATSANSQAVFLPAELSGDLLNNKTEFEDRLRRFLSSDCPPQYQEQIKAYFRSLLQAGTTENSAPQTAPEVQ